MDWNNVVSAVATDGGLLVTERQADGTIGATPRLMPYEQALARQTPKLGQVQTYVLVPKYLGGKQLTKPGTATLSKPPIMMFESTKTEALNFAQSEAEGVWRRWYCWTLYHLEPGQQLWDGTKLATELQKQIDWTNCPLDYMEPPPGELT